MAESFSDPVVKSPVMPTPKPAAVIVEELDDDKLWAKSLVRRIKQIKDEDMKGDFKQHVNVIALQAVRGTWHVSPANFPSALLSMGRSGFLSSPASSSRRRLVRNRVRRRVPQVILVVGQTLADRLALASSVSRCQRQETWVTWVCQWVACTT